MEINELISKLKEYNGESAIYVWIRGLDKAYPITDLFIDSINEEGIYIDIDDRNLVDLSKIWHDASEEPILHKPILIQCGYPLHTYEATALSEDVIWGDFVVLNAIFRWAYIKDLLPKGGEK